MTFDSLRLQKYFYIGYIYKKCDQYDYYYLTEAGSIRENTVYFAAYGALSFLLICSVICIYLLGFPRMDLSKEAASFKEALQHHSDAALLKKPQTLDDLLPEEIPGDQPLPEWWGVNRD